MFFKYSHSVDVAWQRIRQCLWWYSVSTQTAVFCFALSLVHHVWLIFLNYRPPDSLSMSHALPASDFRTLFRLWIFSHRSAWREHRNLKDFRLIDCRDNVASYTDVKCYVVFSIPRSEEYWRRFFDRQFKFCFCVNFLLVEIVLHLAGLFTIWKLRGMSSEPVHTSGEGRYFFFWDFTEIVFCLNTVQNY